ncbi:MAG: hypothetical protein AB7F53_05155 [Nitrososphaeraceae archaeon]
MRFANNIDQYNFFNQFIDGNVRNKERGRDFERNFDDTFDEMKNEMNTKFSEQLKNFENRIRKDLAKELIILKWN